MSLLCSTYSLQGDFDLEISAPTTELLDIDWDITMNFKKFGGINIVVK